MANLFSKHKLFSLVFFIFLAAVAVRFLYFPDNVHFAFDQARDSFTALEILKGDLKLVGPPSFLSNKIFPGPLIFYIYVPIYLIFKNSPEAVSALFRIWNSLGVFLVFLIGYILFNKRAGIIAAILFAFSYEQSQYALFISHQPLAVITILLFYLGLSLYLFQKKPAGIVLATLGLSLSIQFHYGYVFLIPAFITCLIVFRKKMLPLKVKWIFSSVLIFILTTFTFVLTEIKYHFLSILLSQNSSANKVQFFSGFHFEQTLNTANRFLHDSFLANYQLTPLLGITLAAAVIYLLYQKKLRDRIIFLIIWFIFGLSLYLLSGVSSYYYSAATSVSLLILSAYFIAKLFSINKFFGLLIIFAIIANNLLSIFTINSHGLNSDIVIQPGMATSNQRHVLDYVYIKSQGKPFAVNALTIPLYVNTTWSYLFQWYGQQKYGYLPVWIGPTALGYAGNLQVVNARSKLPEKQFLIIEPPVGIREGDKERFFREEGYFTKVIEEKQFGTIVVQLRQPY